MVRDFLSPHGFDVSIEGRGDAATRRIIEENPDVVILATGALTSDRVLPGSDNKILTYYRVYTDTGKIPFGTAWLVEPMTNKSFQDMYKGMRRRIKDLHD